MTLGLGMSGWWKTTAGLLLLSLPSLYVPTIVKLTVVCPRHYYRMSDEPAIDASDAVSSRSSVLGPALNEIDIWQITFRRGILDVNPACLC